MGPRRGGWPLGLRPGGSAARVGGTEDIGSLSIKWAQHRRTVAVGRPREAGTMRRTVRLTLAGAVAALTFTLLPAVAAQAAPTISASCSASGLLHPLDSPSCSVSLPCPDPGGSLTNFCVYNTTATAGGLINTGPDGSAFEAVKTSEGGVVLHEEDSGPAFCTGGFLASSCSVTTTIATGNTFGGAITSAVGTGTCAMTGGDISLLDNVSCTITAQVFTH